MVEVDENKMKKKEVDVEENRKEEDVVIEENRLRSVHLEQLVVHGQTDEQLELVILAQPGGHHW